MREMILDKINSPKDLKNLDIGKLSALSQEIRDLIVGVVSKKGGHLASSLGAVELTLALHYLLDTPRDTIIFDVGHQTYAHKILTGRRESFVNLREYKGISGFPNSTESPYDTYISGHASTAVSWAQGISEAKKIKKNNSRTVAIVGDGSLTGGMCFEALNACGHAQSDCLVILNHNEMSISPSVGALSNYLVKITSMPVYNRIKNELESFLDHFAITKKLTIKARRFEEALKSLIVPGIFFEELGFRYFGPIDGHDFNKLIPTLKNIIPLKGPKILHIITKKGKGYKFSENNPEDFHSASKFDVATGLAVKETKDGFGEVFSKKLIELARKDKRIVAITAAMPKGTGLHLFKEQFPDRLYDVGIAESHAVGFASGLAKGGIKPVVALYSTFLQRSFDQIIHDVALQNLNVVFAIDRAGAVGEDGPTHHGVFDIGFLRMIPNMVCMAPCDSRELEDSLEFAFSLNSPCSIRYPKGEAYSLGFDEKISLGKSQIISEGKDVCIIALGAMVKNALNCVAVLKDEGISALLVNARFIKPLDENLLNYIGNNFKVIVTLEEGNVACGFGSAIAEFFVNSGISEKAKLIHAGFPDEFITFAKREKLFEIYGLDGYSLASRIRKVLVNEILLQK